MSNETRRYFGKYRGTVVNNLDPERRARLQAVVPDVFGTAPSPWAMPSAPFAAPGAGFVALPPAGAGVWIEFEQGDPDFPIWSGCWWGSRDELPALVSITGSGIVIDNGQGASITLIGNRVRITGVME
jgi:Type VI secretion system/phage-baseplate injector OB domain